MFSSFRSSAALRFCRTARSASPGCERLFSRLFRNLVYARIWEDPVADMAALEITPEDHLV
jgi:S-adenosylmethionine-diacylglycerol 3-amino-3-carboxypropyl transferase